MVKLFFLVKNDNKQTHGLVSGGVTGGSSTLAAITAHQYQPSPFLVGQPQCDVNFLLLARTEFSLLAVVRVLF